MLLQKNTILVLLFFLNISFTFAQMPYIWQNKDKDKIENFEILPDKGYTFEQILKDTSLIFIQNPERVNFQKTKESEYYWIRYSVKNPFPYSKKIYVKIFPMFDNTFYSYNFELNTWQEHHTGLNVVDYQRQPSIAPYLLPAHSIDTFFVKINTKILSSQPNSVRIRLFLISGDAFFKTEQFIFILWVSTCLVMVFFFLYNLYIYLMLRDVTYLYYLIIVFSGIVYITAFNQLFNLFIPFIHLNVHISTEGGIYHVDINNFFLEIAVCLILTSFIQITRYYLKLSEYLPKYEKVFKYFIYLYFIVFVLFNFSSFSGFYYVHHWSTMVTNIFSVLVILLILWVGIKSVLNNYKPARYFLMANGFSLLIMLIMGIYLALYPSLYKDIIDFPNLALLSYTLSFAVALVARVNSIKEELKEKELEAKTLQNQNEEILARNRYIELENEYIIADMVMAVNKEADLQQQMRVEINQKTKLEQQLKQKIELEINQKASLQAKLEANQRELTANALYLYQKNEMLFTLQKQIENLSYKDTTDKNREGIREIKSTLRNDLRLENDWDNFKLHFEEVHPNFFKDLKENYPTLTPNEIRLSAYYHLNMSVKEIATLLNIHPRSVHKAKSRLNKKMGKAESE